VSESGAIVDLDQSLLQQPRHDRANALHTVIPGEGAVGAADRGQPFTLGDRNSEQRQFLRLQHQREQLRGETEWRKRERRKNR
jgi:hypothetical protein